MKTAVTIILLLCAVFASCAAADLKLAQVHVLQSASVEELAAEVELLQAAGFNAIAVRVWQNLDDRFHGLALSDEEPRFTGVYFQTGRAPVIADILTPLSAICRERGIRLYAWMTTRTMDWLDMPSARDWIYDESTFLAARRGQHFDFFNTEFVAYMAELYGDLMQTPVDGIILQDDLVIKTREGFTAAALTSFAHNREIAVPWPGLRNLIMGNRKLFHEWCVYKSNRLLAVLDELRSLAAEHGKEIGVNVYVDTALNPANGLHWLAQDIAALEEDPPDRIFFMAYSPQLATELQIRKQDAAKLLQQAVIEMRLRFGNRLVVKHQLWTEDEETLASVFGRFAGEPADMALTPVNTGVSDLERAAAALKILQGDTGSHDAKD